MISNKEIKILTNTIKVPKLSFFGIHSPWNLATEKTDRTWGSKKHIKNRSDIMFLNVNKDISNKYIK